MTIQHFHPVDAVAFDATDELDAHFMTTPIYDQTLRDQRSVELQMPTQNVLEVIDSIIQAEQEQSDAIVDEQWMWWKAWACILAAGAMLGLIGYGLLVSA